MWEWDLGDQIRAFLTILFDFFAKLNSVSSPTFSIGTFCTDISRVIFVTLRANICGLVQ